MNLKASATGIAGIFGTPQTSDGRENQSNPIGSTLPLQDASPQTTPWGTSPHSGSVAEPVI